MFARSTHFTKLGHNRQKLWLLMGQVLHWVPIGSIHSVSRLMPKSNGQKLQKDTEISLFLSVQILCEKALQCLFSCKKVFSWSSEVGQTRGQNSNQIALVPFPGISGHFRLVIY